LAVPSVAGGPFLGLLSLHSASREQRETEEKTFISSMCIMPDKRAIRQACFDMLQSKLAALEKRIQEAQAAASEDSKSSAGDKYETSREMVKQEIEKASTQLRHFRRMEEVLRQLDAARAVDTVDFGSLVQSNEGIYYFSVSLGKVPVDDRTTIYALSITSPLGKALQGKREGEQVSFRGRTIAIESLG